MCDDEILNQNLREVFSITPGNNVQLFIGEILRAFAGIVDTKDDYTNGHSLRVAKYTKLLTLELGYDEVIAERYYYAALLHDIGKITTPRQILLKDSRLTSDEFATMREHPITGRQILCGVTSMPELAAAAAYHHERPDGEGYPEGLSGSAIPIVARIIAVADTFDAMYSVRPYRERMNFKRSVSIIKNGAGTQFFENVVEAFMRLVAKGKIHPAEDDYGGGCMEDIDNIGKCALA